MEFKVPRDHIEEIFGEDRKLDIDKIKGENIKYGPVLIDTVTFTFRYFFLDNIKYKCYIIAERWLNYGI